MVFKIAKTELRNLFYSPIAWFLLIVFMVQCSMSYLHTVDMYAQAQEMNGIGLKFMRDVTSRIFAGREGLFSSVMKNLYLYIPLLTMGLISREINTGTIKLLYSSPVKVREIVLGKYLAMMIYSFILVGIISIFMFAGYFQIRSLDIGMLLSATLGFYLLLCAYSAIGLFMSGLSTYQVVAAISTFIMIGILTYIGTLWQNIDFVRDLTYFLSLSGRTEHMLGGLITTRDILYFLIIVYIFLGLTIYKLKSGRDSKPFLIRAGRYSVIIVSALLLGYITSRPSLIGYLDTTANKKRTLTYNVQQIIKDFGDEKLEVIVYNNLLDNYSAVGFPDMKNRFLEVWEPYTRFKPDIRFSYVSYYDSTFENYKDLQSQYPGKNLAEMAALHAKNLRVNFSAFKTPAEIRKIVDLRPELNRFVMQLKYKDRSTFLRIFDDTEVFPGETEVAAAFKRLQLAKLPTIVFATGNLERSINSKGERDYRTLTNATTFRYSMINQGFDVDTVLLDQQDIPLKTATLVIADPRTALSTIAISKIRQYIASGGNLIIAGEPGKQDILAPVLSDLGVALMGGMIVQQTPDISADLSLNRITPLAADFSKPLHQDYLDSLPVAMPTATGIHISSQTGFQVKPLLLTDKSASWLTQKKIVTDSAAIVFSAADGDVRESYPTAVALTRSIKGKEQRIIVTGDADFMSNAELSRFNIETGTFAFNTALYSWLCYSEFPIDASRPEPKDKRMKVSTEQVAFHKIILTWILPGLMLIFASILLIRRKRQ